MQKETEPLKRQHLLFAHIPFTFYVSLNINCTYMHLVRWCDRVCECECAVAIAEEQSELINLTENIN